jgi:hypothetical protein
VANEKHGGREVEVADGKLVMFFMFVPEFGDKAGVIRRGNGAPFVKEVEDAELLIVNEFQDRQVIFVGYSFELMC